MSSSKLVASQPFSQITVNTVSGKKVVLGQISNPDVWQLIIVYRGKHCPLCTSYLQELNEILTELKELKVETIAVSADPLEKARVHIAQINPNFEVGYDLTIEQMQILGLYISHPRSPEEHDRPFAEPGLFVVNEEGLVHIVDISNAPFTRTDLKTLVMGLKFIRNPENNYPIRGTYQ